MDGFLKIISDINGAVYSFVGGPVMLVLMGVTGIYFSIRLRFFQLTGFGVWIKKTLGSISAQRKSKGAVSPFQAMSAALAGTIGVGNIVGVAMAISIGGPGAVFWMWVSAFFGMMTKYSEVVLAVNYRKRNSHGEWVGGPMYYIEQGLGVRWPAVLFALFALIATFGIGNMSQANSVAISMENAFGIPKITTGIVLALFAALVILGGIRRIAGVAELIVPFMALAYLAGGLIVIIARADALRGVFAAIFENAFDIKAAGGGILGSAMAMAIRQGVSRGIFSNEAGLGSAPIIHATADVEHPARQGLWGIFEVFADTIVVCTISALVILQSGVLGTVSAMGEPLNGAELSAAAFDSVFPGFGTIFISLAIALFAAVTILSWSYYGEKSLEYLRRGKPFKGALFIYRSVFILSIVAGATMKLDLVWALSDTFNALMALPNLAAMLLLSGVVVKLTKEYLS